MNKYIKYERWTHHKFSSLPTPDHDLKTFKCTEEIPPMPCLLLCTPSWSSIKAQTQAPRALSWLPTCLVEPTPLALLPWGPLSVCSDSVFLGPVSIINFVFLHLSVTPLCPHLTDYHRKECRTGYKGLKEQKGWGEEVKEIHWFLIPNVLPIWPWLRKECSSLGKPYRLRPWSCPWIPHGPILMTGFPCFLKVRVMPLTFMEDLH